jgi:hypothetical protein
VETSLLAQVASRTLRLNQKQNRVAIAVNQNVDDFLNVPGGLALLHHATERPPIKMGKPGLNRPFQGFTVNVS